MTREEILNSIKDTDRYDDGFAECMYRYDSDEVKAEVNKGLVKHPLAGSRSGTCPKVSNK